MIATAFALLLGATSALAPSVRVLRVDDTATGANDGTSWTDAYTDLVMALAATADGDQVWVAAGRYRPSSIGDRSATFLVSDGVALYGGFAGTEASLAERAGLFDATILSGDLLGDDGPGFANVSDNSHHVVTLDPVVVTVDGFSILGGNAVNDDGGGLHAPILGSQSIANCVFRANRADRQGGALYLAPGDGALVRHCAFLGNHADLEGGAVRMLPIDLPPRFESCRFFGNTSGGGGGAIAIGWVEIVNCEFSGNSADGSAAGGGAFFGNGLTLQNCTLSGNTALGSSQGGGGILATGYATVRNSILWGNADDDGTGELSQIRVGSHPAELEVRSSCVEGWTGNAGVGHDVLFGDPRFLDFVGADGVAGTIDDDLRLDLGSPCVDTAEDPAGDLPLPPTDVAGRRRYTNSLDCDAGGVLDIGAHERAEVDRTTNFCSQAPTSLGVPAEIVAPCTLSVAGGTLPLVAGPVRSHVGFFFYGSEPTSTPFGGDTFCIGGETHRLPPPERRGRFLVLDLDLAHPQAAAFLPGSTWRIQSLFRDAGRLRLSDAVTITFRE